MSERIRLAAGQVTAYELLSNDDYLVNNFPRQADMTASVLWRASQPDKMLMQELRPSLGRGGGNFYGNYSGELAFYRLSEDMRQYLYTTIMSSKPFATVTVYMATTLSGFQVMVGELVAPFASNADTDFSTMGYEHTHSNVFTFRRGRILTVSNLLLGDGESYLLLGNGIDRLSLGGQ